MEEVGHILEINTGDPTGPGYKFTVCSDCCEKKVEDL
jgi:hypothetical protein